MKMGLNERLLRKAVKELIKQGKPAKSSYGSCKYVLYENGKELNCLIGKLVPKQHRKYLLEGKCAKTTIELLTLKTKNRKYKPKKSSSLRPRIALLSPLETWVLEVPN